MEDDPFDFKLGVDALKAKTESKLTTLENLQNKIGNDVHALSGSIVKDSAPIGTTNGVEAKSTSSSSSSKSSTEDEQKKRKDNNADVNATIDSFSTETKVILTTLGKILERLEALELVALRNAKEVARVEHALHGFIVGQTRKENGKEPITSANLFTVADSEGEEEEKGEKEEEENKENIARLHREEEWGSARSGPPPPGGAHHPPHYPPHNPPPHHHAAPPPPPPHQHRDPYGPPSFARGGRGGPPPPPPPPHERSGSPSGETAAYYPGIDHPHPHPHPHRSPPPPHHGNPSAPPPQHHGHPPPPSHAQHDPYYQAVPYPSPPPPSPPQVQNEDIPLDVIVGEFASMGFTRDEVMTVLGKMEARNEQKEMNSILDKLMAGEGRL